MAAEVAMAYRLELGMVEALMQTKTISYHFRRRSARESERRNQRLVEAYWAQSPEGPGAAQTRTRMLEAGIPLRATSVRTRSMVRGPFGWRVEATWR